MEFFEKLEKKATETFNCAAETTNKIASETKIKIKINNLKGKIEDIYKEIGKKVYQKYVLDGNLDIKEEIKDELENISKLTDEIEEYERQRMELKDLKQCENCKNKIDRNSKYCPVCGKEQPSEVVHEVEVVNVEEQVNEDVEEAVEDAVEENKTEE